MNRAILVAEHLAIKLARILLWCVARSFDVAAACEKARTSRKEAA